MNIGQSIKTKVLGGKLSFYYRFLVERTKIDDLNR